MILDPLAAGQVPIDGAYWIVAGLMLLDEDVQTGLLLDFKAKIVEAASQQK